MGNINAVIEFKDASKKYKTKHKLRPMPQSRHGAPGAVVSSFHAFPPTDGVDIQQTDRLYWWVDCKFLPYQDDTIITTVAAYHLRPGQTPIHVCNQADGLISIWTLGKTLKCEALRGTSCNAYPHIATHPNGQQICYIGAGRVIVFDLLSNHKYIKDKDIRNCNFRYVAVSPSSALLAVMSRISSCFELSVFHIDSMYIPAAQLMCHKVCPGFIGSNRYTEQVECKWSPDSQYVAASSSMGHLFIVRRHGLEVFANVMPGIFSMETSRDRLANARSYDFHPQRSHNIISVCTQSNDLYVVDVELKTIIYETLVDTQGTVSCVQYNHTGSVLAVGDSQLCIRLYDGKTMDFLYMLDTKEQQQSPTNGLSVVSPTILRMDFSYEETHLAVCSTDGMVRVWQLLPEFSLQCLCRKAILRNVSQRNIHKLPLPKQMLLFLLQWPCV